MVIHVCCQQCGGKFKGKDELAGRTVPCPSCKTPLIVETSQAQLVEPLEDTVLDPLGVSEIHSEANLGNQYINCPSCSTPMAATAVLCVNCGYDRRTENRLHTKKGGGQFFDVRQIDQRNVLYIRRGFLGLWKRPIPLADYDAIVVDYHEDRADPDEDTVAAFGALYRFVAALSAGASVQTAIENAYTSDRYTVQLMKFSRRNTITIHFGGDREEMSALINAAQSIVPTLTVERAPLPDWWGS